ncbi:PAS domain S-box protein [Rubellimicrobium rubrum]|uniref:histidine kinase n=1 Tax=Rubellimicrobium rubrum TaxID=2585369 RepID=A0A5C4MVU7_9RHOB|nr:sensor histidine kinase [Rubellimicrobium rubrum]TNC48498.1 PAS domain S-box protein [Rubellimicrobium rubrum]
MNGSLTQDDLEAGQLRTLLRATSGVHFRLSADGALMTHLSGRDIDETLTVPIDDWLERFIPPKDRDLVRRTLARGRQERCALDLEHRVLRPDGTLRWLQSWLIPLPGPGGEVLGWIGAARDVTARHEAEVQLAEREERLRLALGVAGLGSWDWDLDSGRVTWSAEHLALLGYVPGQVIPSFEAWAARVHPDDLVAVQARITEARDNGLRYEAEFRVLPGEGATRWCRAQGRFLYDATGRPVRMLGVMQDVTPEKEAEARQRLLLAELQHRVRNTMAVIRSIVRRSAQSATSKDDYATHLEGRLSALTRAQSALTRAPSGNVDLEAILRDEFQAAAMGADRLVLSGPPVRLSARQAETMALVVHELTTNAIKHGAFAIPHGTVAVVWSISDGDPSRVLLRWTETGGRRSGSPRRKGFGTELLERMLPYSLGAQSRLQYRPEGFGCEIELPLSATPD